MSKYRHRSSNRFYVNTLIRMSDTCSLCGAPFTSRREVTLDHIVPRAKGGETTIENLQLAHETCNRSKADMTPDEWAALNE